MPSTYIAYFDEFGHIGPFVSRHDPKHKTSPVFGLAGIILPANTARSFSAWFHWYKESIFSYEIKNSGIPSYNWEKKGSALFKTHGTLKYGKNNLYILRTVVAKLRQCGGYIMYAGIKKYTPPIQHNSNNLYTSILTEALKHVHTFSAKRHAFSLVVLDENGGDEQRLRVVNRSAVSMFGNRAYNTIIEPVFQAESHLYQNLQCADWICAILTRIFAYKIDPVQYPELKWTEEHGYDAVIAQNCANSSMTLTSAKTGFSPTKYPRSAAQVAAQGAT